MPISDLDSLKVICFSRCQQGASLRKRSLDWTELNIGLSPWTYLHLLLDIVAQQSVGLDALGQGQHHSVQRAPLCHLLMGFLISTLFTF